MNQADDDIGHDFRPPSFDNLASDGLMGRMGLTCQMIFASSPFGPLPSESRTYLASLLSLSQIQMPFCPQEMR